MSVLKDAARALRGGGMGRREIAERLGMHVDTVSRYTADLDKFAASRVENPAELAYARALAADECPVSEIAESLSRSTDWVRKWTGWESSHAAGVEAARMKKAVDAL